MKKTYVFLSLIVFFVLGISTVMMAQTHKKKKKKKHSTEQSTAEADSIAAAKTRDSLAMIAAATPAAEPVDTTHQLTDGLVADTSFMSMAGIELDTNKVVDGFYRRPMLQGARPFAYPKENKFNVKFYKRIWRTINLKDSANRIFAMPGHSLMALIMDAIKAQKLVAYADPGFTKALTYEKLLRQMNDSVAVEEIDTTTGQGTGITHMKFNPFNPEDVVTFEIKEDIFVDKVRGRLITQIIGIGPVKKEKGMHGESLEGEIHPFYLYFPQCRNVFASKEAFDVHSNDNEVISYDDLFIQRNFKSVIVMESNPGDLRIRDKFPNADDQKREADRIEKELKDYKNKIWKY